MPIEDDHDDGPWYLGRARDEFNKRQRGQEMNRIDQEDDPVQVISFFRKKKDYGHDAKLFAVGSRSKERRSRAGG